VATAAEHSRRYRARRHDDEIVPRSRCRRDSPNSGDVVLATAAFMIVAMWIFPEVGGKKYVSKENCWRKFGNTCPKSPALLL
jgi:hypothetical protein